MIIKINVLRTKTLDLDKFAVYIKLKNDLYCCGFRYQYTLTTLVLTIHFVYSMHDPNQCDCVDVRRPIINFLIRCPTHR